MSLKIDSFGQLLKTLLPNDVTLGGMLIAARFVQPENAEFPIVVTASGISNVINPVHPRKAELLIAVSVVGSFTVLKKVLYAKTPVGKVVTPSGTII